jgi:hypothetical protein
MRDHPSMARQDRNGHVFFDSTNVTFATTGGPPPFIQTVNSRNVVVKLGLSYKLF